MKTKLLVFLALCATFTFFSSCKKNEPKVDAREQFLGAWKGTIIYIVGTSTNSFDRYVVIKKTDNSLNKITISNFSNATNFAVSFTGTVNGSTVTFDQWVDTFYNEDKDKKPKTTYTFTQNGTGSISGSTLTSTGKVKVLIDDDTDPLDGTWSCIWTKQ